MFDGSGGCQIDNGGGNFVGSLSPRTVRAEALDLRIGPLFRWTGFPEGLRQEEEQREQRVHNHNMTVIRRGGADDLPEVTAIQHASPGAALWNAVDYLE